MSEIQTRNSLYGFEYRTDAVDERRVPQKERRTYNIKQLWQRNHEIVNLAARGFKNSEIAKMLNICIQTVSSTLNSDLGQYKLSEVRMSRDEEAKKVTEEIRKLTNKALNVYNQILDDESGECRLMDKKKTADTVLLELSGLRVPTKVQSSSVHATLTSDELEDFKRRGLEAARKSGMIIDVETEQLTDGNGNGNGNGNGSKPEADRDED